jgi:EmrB/QacA subfamily drug resistance transporter
MSRPQIAAVTAALMLSLFLASMEATVVGTAMPTIVSQLSGLELYSWVFSAYSLTSTTTVPIYGKLSDLYGRRPVFLIALAIFIIGSIVAGASNSMVMLILARALQGLGAGGILPLVFIMIGDMFSLDQRARLQGLFSGVWGVSSVIGPLLGGFLVDRVSWHWVFYINVVPALIAAGLFIFGWREHARTSAEPVQLDIVGAVLLTTGVAMLLLGLFQFGTPTGWLLLGGAVVLFAILFAVERRAADPMLPIGLFGERLFLIACLHGVLVGTAIFGTASFVPLFAQTVLGTSATIAGAMLTPQLMGWVASSIVATRLLLRTSYRTLIVIGMVIALVGTLLVLSSSMLRSPVLLLVGMGCTGIGMGMCIPSFQLAVQSSVQRRMLGTATSTLTFSRNIGGTLGVSIMGAILSVGLSSALIGLGAGEGVSVNSLLDQANAGGMLSNPAVVSALAQALQGVFLFSCASTVLALLAGLLTPRGSVRQLEDQRIAGESATEAEASIAH